MSLAVEMYTLFLELYPDSEDVDKAERRLVYAHLASFKGPNFDAKGLDEAKTRLLALKQREPYTAQALGADALLTRIDASEADKLLETARWYARTNDPVSADHTLRRLVRYYPGTAAARTALDELDGLAERLPPAWVARVRAAPTTPDPAGSRPTTAPGSEAAPTPASPRADARGGRT